MLPFFSLALRLVSLIAWLLSFHKPRHPPADPDMIIGPDAEDLFDGPDDADETPRSSPVVPADIPLAIPFARPASAHPAEPAKPTLTYMHADVWAVVAHIPSPAERHMAGTLLLSHGVQARFSETEGDLLCPAEEAPTAAEILRGTPGRAYVVYREQA